MYLPIVIINVPPFLQISFSTIPFFSQTNINLFCTKKSSCSSLPKAEYYYFNLQCLFNLHHGFCILTDIYLKKTFKMCEGYSAILLVNKITHALKTSSAFLITKIKKANLNQ